MADFDKMISLFDDLKIKYNSVCPWSEIERDGGKHIYLLNGDGYAGFWCEFKFTSEGKYKNYACWE